MKSHRTIYLKNFPRLGSCTSTPLKDKVMLMRLYNLVGPEVYYLYEASEVSEEHELDSFKDSYFSAIAAHENMKPIQIRYSDLPPTLNIDHTFSPCRLGDL